MIAVLGRVVAVVVAVCMALTFAGPSAAQPRAPLGHAGRWVTDADGRVVILHGVNMVYKVPPYAPDAAGFGANDAAFLQDHGFNSVRLGVLHVGVEPQPGAYDAGYLARIARTVQTLGDHGVFSLLDFHQDMYNERFQGEGEPDWSVQDDGLPAAPQTGFPGNYIAMPALERAFDHFWQNSSGPDGPGLQERYAQAWAHVAARFQGNPFVMGDDLFNEPWPGSQWPTCANLEGCPAFDQAYLAPFMKSVIAAIRSADPSLVTYYEPNVLFDFGADTSIGSPGDSRSGMSFHDYCVVGNFGIPQSGLAGMGCDQAEQRVFQNADAQSQRTGDALLLTEWGSTDSATTLTRVADEADAQLMPWTEWAYCGCEDPTGSIPPATEGLVLDPSKPPTGANVKAEKLAILARPHPDAVAGTPLSLASSGYRFAWSTARAGGHGRFPAGSLTTYFVPGLRSGYTVSVRGGRAVSKANAKLLQVESLPGAKRVSFRISGRTHGR